MKFNDRKIKCKKIQKTDINGIALPESFYAVISDETTEEGTPLNAETMNKGNWRDDESLSFTTKNISADIVAEPNVTKVYTDEQGETWLIPPKGRGERYSLSSGQAALNNLNNLTNVTTGRVDTLQNILNNSVDIFTNPCTAEEYDAMDLTALDYDNKDIKAMDYDMCGKLALTSNNDNTAGYSIFDLRDPTTGQKNYLQDIINNLFNLITQP